MKLKALISKVLNRRKVEPNPFVPQFEDYSETDLNHVRHLVRPSEIRRATDDSLRWSWDVVEAAPRGIKDVSHLSVELFREMARRGIYAG